MPFAAGRPLDEDKARQVQTLLHDLLAMSEKSYSGVFRFLNLAEIEADLNASGIDASAFLPAVADSILREFVRPPNVYLQLDSGTYLTVFVNMDASSVDAACAEAKEWIKHAILAKSAVRSVDIGVHIREMPPRAALATSFFDLAAFASAGVAVAGAAPGDAEPESSLYVAFRPVWNARKKAVSMYMVGLRRESSSGAVDFGYSASRGMQNLRRTAQVDQRMMQAAAEAIEQGQRQGEAFALIAPVSYAAFRSDTLAPSYYDSLFAIPEGVRGLLCLQLIVTDPNVPVDPLRWNIRNLSRFCNSVIAQVPPTMSSIGQFKGMRVGAVGTSANGLARAGTRAARMLRRFAAGVGEAPLFLTGVEDRLVAAAAIRAGFSHLAGSFVGIDCARPEGLRACSFEDLVAGARSRFGAAASGSPDREAPAGCKAARRAA